MGYASSLTLSRQDYTTYIAKTTNPGTAAAVYKTDAGMVPVGLKLEPMTFAFAWKFWKDVCKIEVSSLSVFLVCMCVNLFLSHNNPCFSCNVAITNVLVSHTCEISFHDVIDCSNCTHVYIMTSSYDLWSKDGYICWIHLCNKKNPTFVDC